MNKMISSAEKGMSGLTELKSRLYFVVLAVLVYRLGAHIPVPGLDPSRLANFFGEQQNTIFGLFNMFSGGALSRVTVFAIGIMPYISASIILQLLTVVIPSLEKLAKEGEEGRPKSPRRPRTRNRRDVVTGHRRDDAGPHTKGEIEFLDHRVVGALLGPKDSARPSRSEEFIGDIAGNEKCRR